MKLFLVRHAESEANSQGALSTVLPGPPLSGTGARQADALSATFGHTDGGDPSSTGPAGVIDAVYASPMLRAQQTALPLARARGLPVGVLDGVQEVEAGVHEGAIGPSGLTAYLTTVQRWVGGDLSVRIPGGVTGFEVVSRFDSAVGGVLARHGRESTVVVISHSVALRVWVGTRASNVSPAAAATASLDNCGVIEVDVQAGGAYVVTRWAGVVDA